jgi:AcrR family transcriptional regulator
MSKKPSKRIANANHGTRQQLIKTAIREFAVHGFDEPSIRDLTMAAGVNQAAINYHFGSKDGLIKTIFEELATPVIEERFKKLDELERQAGQKRLSLEAVIRVMVEPVVRSAKGGRGGQSYLAKLLLIASSLRSKPIEHQVETMHDELALRFVAAIAKAAPHLSRVQVMWRYKFTLGALLYTLSDHMQNHRLRRLSGGECDTDNPDEILDNLVPYIVAGFTDRPGPGTHNGGISGASHMR